MTVSKSVIALKPDIFAAVTAEESALFGKVIVATAFSRQIVISVLKKFF
jgi:hypothetical protein